MLPKKFRSFAQSHNFTVIEELPRGYCSRIFTDGTRILKVPFQGEEQTSGARAAILIQQVNGPKIYAHHEPTGALIMERIPGGQSLLTTIVSNEIPSPSMGRVREGLPADPMNMSDIPIFIPLAQAMSTLPATNFPLLANFYKNPPKIAKKLIETTPKHVFLHGDLHHENILFDERTSTYRPIDPKGLIGDPNFEPVAFLRNPILTLPDNPNLYKFTRDRIICISNALNLDPFRIAAWLYVDRYCHLQEDPNPRWQSVLPTFNQLMTDFKM
ncbi:hypothetical protein CCB80_09315 [Armatimonadetes bacterium Uphvl-Ar1]|nr:hypothetical protein CCB80_09315 [Armatimonadetes bacterium Uphvl-Ar1]